MELSIYLAQLLGVVLTVIGLALLIRTDYYQKMYQQIVKDDVMVTYSGIIALVIGTVIVLAHNIWEGSWVLILTLFGWAGVVKGVFLLLLPSESSKLSTKLLKRKGFFVFAGLFYLILGLVLGYFGFYS